MAPFGTSRRTDVAVPSKPTLATDVAAPVMTTDTDWTVPVVASGTLVAVPVTTASRDVAMPVVTAKTDVVSPDKTFATLLEPLGLMEEYNDVFVKSGIPIQVCTDRITELVLRFVQLLFMPERCVARAQARQLSHTLSPPRALLAGIR